MKTNSVFTKEEKKRAKAAHKHDLRTDPTWFEAKRVDLAKEIVTSPAPRWGGFKFHFLNQAV